MKKSLLMVTLFIFLIGCVTTNKSLWDKPQISVDPLVTKWLEAPTKTADETLGIIIISKAPLGDYKFLKKVRPHRYTAHVTKSQLRTLLRDERIMRISSGQQILH